MGARRAAPSRVGLLATLALAAGCGAGGAQAPTQVEEETAEASVRRVGSAWASTVEERGTPGGRRSLARYRSVQTIRLLLTGSERGEEEVDAREELELTSGGRVVCSAKGARPVELRFGRRRGEPALEVVRPRLLLRRSCQGGRPPDPVLTIPAERVRFVLRADQLVPFEPAGERRVFLPE